MVGSSDLYLRAHTIATGRAFSRRRCQPSRIARPRGWERLNPRRSSSQACSVRVVIGRGRPHARRDEQAQAIAQSHHFPVVMSQRWRERTPLFATPTPASMTARRRTGMKFAHTNTARTGCGGACIESGRGASLFARDGLMKHGVGLRSLYTAAGSSAAVATKR